MANYHPRQIRGNWREGYALDIHTLSRDCVRKTRDAPQLKNVYALDERLRLLEGLHTVDASATSGRKILLFDDLYRSGATMNSITTLLYEQGSASDVFALTIARTMSNR